TRPDRACVGSGPESPGLSRQAVRRDRHQSVASSTRSPARSIVRSTFSPPLSKAPSCVSHAASPIPRNTSTLSTHVTLRIFMTPPASQFSSPGTIAIGNLLQFALERRDFLLRLVASYSIAL